MIQFLTKNSKIDTGKSMLIQLPGVFPDIFAILKGTVYYLSLIYLPFPSSEE